VSYLSFDKGNDVTKTIFDELKFDECRVGYQRNLAFKPCVVLIFLEALSDVSQNVVCALAMNSHAIHSGR
jgi:hypothetical protein